MDTTILFIISTALLIVMYVMYRNEQKSTHHLKQIVGYKNADGVIVWGNDQRKWDSEWQVGDPSYVLLSDGSSLDQDLKPCPPGTYGPTCESKMCPTASSGAGFYSWGNASSVCQANGFSKCNSHTGQCE